MTLTESGSRRPRVICHMLASVDGRIVVEYEAVHAGYGPGGWLCGRVSVARR